MNKLSSIEQKIGVLEEQSKKTSENVQSLKNLFDNAQVKVYETK